MNEISFKRRNESFFHLSVRTMDLKGFPTDPEEQFVQINKVCRELNEVYHIKFYAYVYMLDHFHILLSVENQILDSTKVEFFKLMIIERFKVHQISIKSYIYVRISSFYSFIETYKYIYANPLKDGLCENLIDYYFSSLSWQLGRRKSQFEVLDVAQLASHPQKWIYEFEKTAAFGLI